MPHSNYSRKTYRIKIQNLIKYIKLNSICMDCGIDKSLTFDHVKGDKKFDLANAARHTFKQVNIELMKCEIVCRHCHDLREKSRYRHSAHLMIKLGDLING